MSRPLRLEFCGALYHVTSRGDRREDIYDDDEDRERFLEILGGVVSDFNWVCHAYCLMDNHYHLLIATPDGNLAKGMRQLNGVYTQASNRRHRRGGHLFQGRYKAILVDEDAYLLEVARYVVLNPLRAGMVSAVEAWPWSSYLAMLGEAPRPEWLTVDAVLGQFGKRRATAREKYARFVAEGRGLGLLMGATGVGGLIGAFVATNMSEVRKKGPLMGFGALFMSGCFVVFGTTSLWLPLTAAFWGAAVMLILGNVGAMIFQVTNNTIIQANVPDEYRGRVMSFLMMSFGTMPLGVVPVAYAADRWGAPAATIGAQLIAVAAVVLMFGLSKRLRQLEFGSLERAEMSPAQAAILVAEGKISQEEADRLTGRARPGATPAPVTATAGRGDGQAAG